MNRLLLAAAALASCLVLPAQSFEMPSRELVRPADAAVTFRAPQLAVQQSVVLPAAVEKAVTAQPQQPGGPVQIGFVRAVAKSAEVAQWVPAAGGYVATLELGSAGSAGIRARLDLSPNAGVIEVRVQGADGPLHLVTANAARSTEAWTAYTDGETQRVELFSRQRPEAGAVRVGAIVHFTASPFEKVAGACTVPSMCSTGNTALDAAITERRKSVMRINFVSHGGSFLCSATIINSQKFPAAYVLTANHCIDNAASANSITSWWNYESASCGDLSPSPNRVQNGDGMQLVFTNYSIDGTLLLMNSAPPPGAVYAAFNTAAMPSGTSIVSLSHPDGDTMRLALGNTTQQYGIIGRPQTMTGVRFSRGIIQGGSSGSGLFTLANGELQMRGILSATTVREGGMSCTTTTEEGLYGALSTFGPQMLQFVNLGAPPADDAPNRVQDVAAVGAQALAVNGGVVAYDNRRIDYAGDVDLYAFTLTSPAWVSVWTDGPNIDTIGNLLDANGVVLGTAEGEIPATNDDIMADSNHFGITRRLTAGTYYVQVGHFEATGTGAYNLKMRADALETNYTGLWWSLPAASENGWGINFNHQDNTLFATLFTYSANGAPVWLVMSEGVRQPDGSFQGTLFRTSGPAFNTVPWPARGAQPTAAGTMRVSFTPTGTAQLSYTYEGATVTKNLLRQRFGSALPLCTWSAFDRSFDENYQDLWWNPAESGWGVNIAHQDDTLFATLFTYDASGQPTWFVMSRGDMMSPGVYTGTLYRTTGPAFNTTPWPTSLAPPTSVGSMTFHFTHGNQATLTYSVNGASVVKQIQRQTFGALRPSCES
jgi:lysyl endopeptidase